MMATESMSSALRPGPAEDGAMEHPSSPMNAGGMVAGRDGSPPSPPPDHRHHMPPHSELSMGYRPHPGSYGPPPGYPPSYPGYGGPPLSPYSHHGYHRPPPPGSYPPPHHSPPYPYGYPPGGPRSYHYSSYEASYPGQQPPRQGAPYRPSPPGQPRPGAPPTSQLSSPTKGSPPGVAGVASPNRSPPSAPPRPPKGTDHVEVEKLRAAAATELTHDEVKPIQTDFHFFLKDNMEKYRKLAEEEVRKSTEGDELDPFLVNTNLNTRLMKAWEDLKADERETYMGKEEEDRARFMEEDEIASRHCATLTARGKSPRTSDKSKREERQESDTKPATSPDRESPNKARKPDSESEDESPKSETNQNEGETVELDSSKKRSPETTPEGDSYESPTKKSRNAEEGSG